MAKRYKTTNSKKLGQRNLRRFEISEKNRKE